MGVRKIRIASLVVLTGLAVAVVSLFLTSRGPKTPQYVFLICMDAVRPDHLSCYGYSRQTSPRINDLANKGAVFEDAISQAPWTLPSIATILSSTFPCQHGARRTEGTRAAYSGLSHNFIETLTSLGFKTALFTGGLAIRGKVPAAELSAAAIDWLGDNLEHDCFIVIHHYDTHGPYVASPRCIDRLDPGYEGPFRYRFGEFKMLKQARVGRLTEVIDLSAADLEHVKALYDCQIMRADESVGMIADSLQAWDCLERSMIILFADHGEEFLEHGSIDHGQTVYEESIKVPLIIFCPSLVKQPRRIAGQVGLIDLGPTILDALGIEKSQHFEGVSLMPLVSSAFSGSPRHERPSGFPTSCLISEAIARRPEKKAMRRPPWKLIYDPFFGASELYNIIEDPLETENLIELNASIASSLTDTLLIMAKHYPGGWCIAWRGLGDSGKVRGSINVGGGLIEAVGHNIFPELDVETDSLLISDDWKTVRFSAVAGPEWQGVETRMASKLDAEFTIALEGRSQLTTSIGKGTSQVTFPLTLDPSQARVERKDLHRLFVNPEVECAVYWVEPGTEPTAMQKHQAELRKQLKAIGYID
jgi:choline-sulfatase